LPPGWAEATIPELIASDGIFTDGDWVESKDQDPNGPVRLTQLADVGEGVFRDQSSRFLADAKARELRCTFLEPGDVLVARMPDPLGRACILPDLGQSAVTAVDVCIVRLGTGGPESRWLMWALNAPRTRRAVSELQSGTTRKRISRKNLATIPLLLPPLNEQRRIVAAIEEQLSRLDAADASLAAATQRLRALRAKALHAAFDLETHAVTIGAIAKVGSGATPKRGRPEYWENGTIPWVTSGQLNESRVSQPAALITEQALRETNVKLWPPGTLLVALYGEGQTRGRCAELTFESTTNQACAAVVLDEHVADRGYVRRYFEARYEANRRLASGGVQPNLSLGLIKTMPIPLPPLEEQRRIVARVEEQLSAIDALRAAIERAQRRSAALRRAVLERAFRGELVPQDPTDEPAEALLARIRATRTDTRTVGRRRE
jgi:type I restriction enzyme S subunit